MTYPDAELDGRTADAAALGALALTNYGHFTTMRVEEGRVRGLGLHLDRLVRDCRTVFGADLDTAYVRGLLRRAVADTTGPVLVRVTVFDPALDLGHPGRPGAPRVLVTRRPAAGLPLPPLRVVTAPYVRDTPRVKHTGLFGALHARRRAQVSGADDVLFTGPDGWILEGPTWNVGFVAADGAVVWPAGDVLPGVTAALLRGTGDHRVQPVTVAGVRGMRAAFAVNAGMGVRPISHIDATAFPLGFPAAAQLLKAYLEIPGKPL
ncbi:aminotransferase class IV [Streptomyces sp. B1866]|uniref:aminotransferase class IV n=1 Tax=Streptomyces sp. B1866 TaxID=3075431 RepID=UPI00288DDA81|nr:aminotransferase class IV [Streptomyces sp. B1866]MDT3399706.1 aminotransferase class IV [Streptomyces sp. B1866]